MKKEPLLWVYFESVVWKRNVLKLTMYVIKLKWNLINMLTWTENGFVALFDVLFFFSFFFFYLFFSHLFVPAKIQILSECYL